MVPSVSVRDTMRVVTPRISSIRRTRADTVKVFLSGNQNLTTHVSAFLRVRLLILNVNSSQNQHRRESTVTSVGISNAGFATALKKSTGGVAFLCIFLVSSTLYKHNSIPAYQISGCTISSSSCRSTFPTLERMGRTTRSSIRAQPSPLVAHSFS